jgi:ribosome maturation factor RimP
MSPLSAGSLVSARQITPEIHSWVLENLRKALAFLQASPNLEEKGVKDLRVREWGIERDEGIVCLEIYLDKGFEEKEGERGNLLNRVGISLEECQAFHGFLLETDVLDVFSDSLEVRVGSPGGEPFLRDEVDFRAAVGSMCSLQTWTKLENRDKFVMLLHDVVPRPEGLAVLLKEGAKEHLIPLGLVRSAQALLFHPQTLPLKKGNSRKKK